MTPQKITRKELLKTPDEFLTFSEKAYLYIQEHSRQFTTGLLIVATVILVALGAKWYFDYSASQALTAYNQALANYGPNPQQAEATIKALETFTKDYAGSAPARYALLDLGEIYFRAGQLPQAENAYQQFIGGLRKEEEHLKPLVLDNLAVIQEAQGKLNQAAATWEQVIAQSNDAVKPDAYLGLGRVYLALGKPQEAQKTYEALIAFAPNSPQAAQAMAKLSGGDK
ncbi:MAG: tetratricopeptide repeat protein [Thermodesulfobacteriota bacterium]